MIIYWLLQFSGLIVYGAILNVKSNFLRLFLVLFLCAFLVNCNASDSSADTATADVQVASVSKDSGSTPDSNKNKSLPAMVLTGTDVIARTKYKPAKVTPGNYSSEMGGATLQVSVTKTASGKFDVQRVYAEPGEKKDTKKYHGLVEADHILTGGELTIEYVHGGILWWEENSGNEFIPSDLCIFLKGVK